MEAILFIFALVTVAGVFLFMLDDLLLDFLGLIKNARPRRISLLEIAGWRDLPKKKLAILIANWHEDEILAEMVAGNLSRIDYPNYRIFLGVYPNDPKTCAVAAQLAKIYPQVTAIVNHLPGPTSKGQLLNYMMKTILMTDESIDGFMLHDSEDIIHPRSLCLVNKLLDSADFVQIPVFSLHVPLSQITSGTYADEFAESHTKDLLIRRDLGAAIPSAGVGTALSKALIKALQHELKGDFLNEKTLTEDYQLGVTAARLGFKTHFECAFIESKNGRDYIATREYFPSEVGASVRQKTRWVTGIAFQGRHNLGWAKHLIDNYFLWRDRRGPFNGILMVLCLALLVLVGSHWLVFKRPPEFLRSGLIAPLIWLNFAHMNWRILSRAYHSAQIYGWLFALLTPLRWPVANVINCLAAWRAFRAYRQSLKNQSTIAWVKTAHRLPVGFGKVKSGGYAT